MGTRANFLCEELNRLRGLDIEPPATANPISPALVDELCDILSVFDDYLLPEELCGRYLDSALPTRLEDCLQAGDLTQTLFRVGMIDVGVFNALRISITREECAERYLFKQSQRMVETFTRLDQEGAEIRDPPPVVECGNTLREIADQVCEYRLRRQSLTQTQTGAAAMLVELIQEVCKRNGDVRHGTRALAYKASFNLYAYLIGDPPVQASDPEWKKNAFVIHKLSTFPPDDLKPLLKQLDEIKTYVEDHDSGRARGAKEYAVRIERVL